MTANSQFFCAHKDAHSSSTVDTINVLMNRHPLAHEMNTHVDMIDTLLDECATLVPHSEATITAVCVGVPTLPSSALSVALAGTTSSVRVPVLSFPWEFCVPLHAECLFETRVGALRTVTDRCETR